MSRPVAMPNAENCTLAELDTAAHAAVSKRSHIRMLAIKCLLMGVTHEQAAGVFNISGRTLSRWIQRFNASGIDGLTEHSRPGQISPEQAVHYRELIRHPQQADQTHWTARKFHGYLTEGLQQEIGYRTVVRWLHEQNFCLKVPQSWPDRQDEAQRRAFMGQLKEYLQDPDIEIWYQDESGIEGDPRPRRRWASKGEKLRQPYLGTHLRMNVSGMVCPRTGEFYALEFTHSDADVFQVFLNHANQDLTLTRSRNIIILDNATWHRAKRIDWGRFEPVFLPPYSPDLNPIERLWLLMKADWFTGFVAKTIDELITRLDMALNWIIKRKTENQITCAIKTEL
jgi:transposase